MPVQSLAGPRIFVLTDTPEPYGKHLCRDGTEPVYTDNVPSLLEYLRGVAVAGLVLEIAKVMQAQLQDRDRLFGYAGTFPVLRSRMHPETGVAFLDDPDCFFRNLDAAAGEHCRGHARISMVLDCEFSGEDDPFLAEPVQASIMDISPGGCFIRTDRTASDQRFLYLRVPELGSTRPIFCNVRWLKSVRDSKAMPGMGVMFIDITPDQAKNISALRLKAS